MNNDQQHRLVRIMGWSAFMIGAAWVLAMTIFVNTAMAGIPFAMVNDFQGHWDYLNGGHWLHGLKSPETIGIAVGICMLAFERARQWKWNSAATRVIVILSPYLIASICDVDRGILFIMPWWLLFFLVFGFFFAPYMTLQMFFQEVDGEFFIDGGGLIIVAGWWSILCSFWWLFLYVDRKGLIIPDDESKIIN